MAKSLFRPRSRVNRSSSLSTAPSSNLAAARSIWQAFTSPQRSRHPRCCSKDWRRMADRMLARSQQAGRQLQMTAGTSARGICSFSANVQRMVRVQRGTACRKVTSMKSAGRFFVGGNWKANGTLDSVSKLVKELNSATVPADVDVICAPPYIYLDMVQKNLSPRYQVAAQNCWVTKGGAYTGEITAEMIKDLGLNWVILGHSERRSLCGEANEVVGKKCAHALASGLSVIACIGETLEQRNGGVMFDILDAQLQAVADNVKDWSKVVLAYEPVWAIGTGVVASPAQAQEVHSYLRQWISIKVSHDTAAGLRIIYGGSVTDSNCSDLGTQTDIDGFLVGGASLKGAAFATICSCRH